MFGKENWTGLRGKLLIYTKAVMWEYMLIVYKMKSWVVKLPSIYLRKLSLWMMGCHC